MRAMNGTHFVVLCTKGHRGKNRVVKEETLDFKYQTRRIVCPTGGSFPVRTCVCMLKGLRERGRFAEECCAV